MIFIRQRGCDYVMYRGRCAGQGANCCFFAAPSLSRLSFFCVRPLFGSFSLLACSPGGYCVAPCSCRDCCVQNTGMALFIYLFIYFWEPRRSKAGSGTASCQTNIKVRQRPDGGRFCRGVSVGVRKERMVVMSQLWCAACFRDSVDDVFSLPFAFE